VFIDHTAVTEYSEAAAVIRKSLSVPDCSEIWQPIGKPEQET